MTDDSPPSTGSGCGRTAGGFLLAAGGLLLLLGAGALFFAMSEGSKVVERVTRPLSMPTPTAVILTPTVIIQRLRGASELTTAISTVETVVDASQDRTLGPFTIGRTRLLYVANGQVRAGVDLEALDEGDVDITGETVTVRLPAPAIQDKKIDVERSRVYDVDQAFFAPAAPALQSQAEQAALAKIVAAACEGGILDEANRRAELAVDRLLSSASPYAVKVITRPPAQDACPAATPPPPATP